MKKTKLLARVKRDSFPKPKAKAKKKRRNMVHVIVERMEQERKWREIERKKSKAQTMVALGKKQTKANDKPYKSRMAKCQRIIAQLHSFGFEDMKFNGDLTTRRMDISILLGKDKNLDTLTVCIFCDESVMLLTPQRTQNAKANKYKTWFIVDDNLLNLRMLITKVVYEHYK